jgi:hypothetical protein
MRIVTSFGYPPGRQCPIREQVPRIPNCFILTPSICGALRLVDLKRVHPKGDGTAIWKRAWDLDLEGIVSKGGAAPYSPAERRIGSRRSAVIAILLWLSNGRRMRAAGKSFPKHDG